jgi:hypothetical protein
MRTLGLCITVWSGARSRPALQTRKADPLVGSARRARASSRHLGQLGRVCSAASSHMPDALEPVRGVATAEADALGARSIDESAAFSARRRSRSSLGTQHACSPPSGERQ